MGKRGREEKRLLAALRRPQAGHQPAHDGRAAGEDRRAAEALVEATWRQTYAALFRLTGGDADRLSTFGLDVDTEPIEPRDRIAVRRHGRLVEHVDEPTLDVLTDDVLPAACLVMNLLELKPDDVDK